MRRLGKPLVPAIIALLVLHVPARSSTGPVTPTFLFHWGAYSELSAVSSVATDAQGDVYVVSYGAAEIVRSDRWGNRLAAWSAAVDFVATNPAGHVLATSYYGNQVREYSNTGVVIRSWGSAGSGPGQFQNPAGLATDRAGNVYVADSNNNRVQKFSGSGAYLASFTSALHLDHPIDVEIGPEGNVIALDYQDNGHGRIVRFSPDGSYLDQWALPNTDYSRAGLGSDRLGNVLVASYTAHEVRKYSRSGSLLAVWGALGGGDGEFQNPSDVACDAEGNVYVGEYSNHRVQKFSGSGELPFEGAGSYLLTIGTFGSGAGQMNGPWGTCTDATGNVYVADTQNHRIQKYTNTGTFLSQWGSFGAGDGQFNQPRSVAVDAGGVVFVVDGGNNRIQKFTSAGAFLGKWGSSGSGAGQFNSPAGIAINSGGDVFVADYGNNRVQRFTNAGTFVLSWGSPGSLEGEFNGPFGIAINAAHHVFVVEQGNQRVQKFRESGGYLTKWNGAAGPDGGFAGPTGIAADAYGHVFVVDYGHGRVLNYSTQGRLLSYWGGTGSGSGQLAAPIGAAVDALGNVYVADTNNSRIQKFVMPPSLAFVSDVGNDQGRQVSLRFLRSSADAAGVGVTVTGYEVYRRIDPLPGPSLVAREAGRGTSPNSAALAGRSWVTTVPAHGDAEYNVVVPTLADANATSSEYSAFLLRAVTADPLTFYTSGTTNGYSIDNLAPPAPTPFLAAYQAGATRLHWGVNAAADFAAFRLYRGSDASFVPGSGNFVTTTSDTGYADPGAAGGWYKLSAVDLNGNESLFAVLGPTQTTGVSSPEPLAFSLVQAGRNPSTDGRVAVEFTLERTGDARVELMDVSGRRIATRTFSAASPGRQIVEFGGARRLAPGLYLVVLRQGGATRHVRTTVLQ